MYIFKQLAIALYLRYVHIKPVYCAVVWIISQLHVIIATIHVASQLASQLNIQLWQLQMSINQYYNSQIITVFVKMVYFLCVQFGLLNWPVTGINSGLLIVMDHQNSLAISMYSYNYLVWMVKQLHSTIANSQLVSIVYLNFFNYRNAHSE